MTGTEKNPDQPEQKLAGKIKMNPLQMMEMQRKSALMQGARGMQDVEAQRRTAYVMHLESVAGYNLRLIELQKENSGVDLSQFKAIVDAASQQFLASAQPKPTPSPA